MSANNDHGQPATQPTHRPTGQLNLTQDDCNLLARALESYASHLHEKRVLTKGRAAADRVFADLLHSFDLRHEVVALFYAIEDATEGSAS